MTPDSLGPEDAGSCDGDAAFVFALARGSAKGRQCLRHIAGVLGETGIESGEAVFGIVQQVKPAVVIAVDTLAAGDPARMATTVQLGNTGIAAGRRRGQPTAGLG